MCGLAGILDPQNGRVPGDVLSRLWRRLEHRGPDDSGWWCLGPEGERFGVDLPPEGLGPARCLLLHRRLSILDLSAAGRQPMTLPSGRWWILLNGEIYNYLELRRELSDLGRRFRSASDTEVLLHALDVWGLAALPRLTGMFAFAALDLQTRRLHLARDPFGIKPLYYSARGEGWAFGSEIQVLLELPEVSRRLCPQSVWEYLRLGLTDAGERTLFEDVRQVPPAQVLSFDLDRPGPPARSTYWTPTHPPIRPISFREAAESIRERFLESVALHLRSDVPVATTLSGGIDSSAVVLAMRALLGSQGEIHAFSFVPDDPELSEERWCDLVVQAAGAKVHKVRLAAGDLQAELRELIRSQEQPFQSSSIFAQEQVFRQVRAQGIKVVLDGQGGDEVFAGYDTHLAARMVALLHRGQIGPALRLWRSPGGSRGAGLRWRLGKVLASFLDDRSDRWARAAVSQEIEPGWMDTDWFRERGVRPRTLRLQGGRDALRHQLTRVLTETMLPALLRYEDRNSMRHSVEGRVPFLNPRLLVFAWSLPEEYLVGPDGQSKRVLREALRGLVPDAILDRRDKVGFLTPQGSWLAQLAPWVEETLGAERLRRLPFLRPKRLRGHWERTQRSRRVDSVLWRWLNLAEWADLFDVTV